MTWLLSDANMYMRTNKNHFIRYRPLTTYHAINYGTAQGQRRTCCSLHAHTRLEPSSLQLESRSTLGLQQ